ncbi:MAG: S-methyl-5-thioribose-1-phosphate isomerase [Armatimonadota bacterium]|nr:S-methyl-5-thioribose-1-phosphate isomerase [Armatimonadota bacterium]
MSIDALVWQDGRLLILDQRLLPLREEWIEAKTWRDVAIAIADMALRGAPLIGIAAAYGMALAQQAGDDLEAAMNGLSATRPTAVNLFNALERVSKADDMLAEAQAIELDERNYNDAIAEAGAQIVHERTAVVTICNTGSLATAGAGTALGIIRRAYALGKITEVFACETRPRLQGLRLTAWELLKDNIPFKIIPDGAAAALLARGEVGMAITGADRIAANGDTANKIGTYGLALICDANAVPFVVAAPTTTIDPHTTTGDNIPIEERAADEITVIEGVRVGPKDCPVWNPAFDVTPSDLIAAIVTEKGVHHPPYGFGT